MSLIELSPNQFRMKIEASDPLLPVSTTTRMRMTGIEL